MFNQCAITTFIKIDVLSNYTFLGFIKQCFIWCFINCEINVFFTALEKCILFKCLEAHILFWLIQHIWWQTRVTYPSYITFSRHWPLFMVFVTLGTQFFYFKIKPNNVFFMIVIFWYIWCLEPAGNVPKILWQSKPQVSRLPTRLSPKLHISERRL